MLENDIYLNWQIIWSILNVIIPIRLSHVLLSIIIYYIWRTYKRMFK